MPEITYNQRSRILDQIHRIPGRVGHSQGRQQREEVRRMFKYVVEQNVEAHQQHLAFGHRVTQRVTSLVNQRVEIAPKLGRDCHAVGMRRLWSQYTNV